MDRLRVVELLKKEWLKNGLARRGSYITTLRILLRALVRLFGWILYRQVRLLRTLLIFVMKTVPICIN